MIRVKHELSYRQRSVSSPNPKPEHNKKKKKKKICFFFSSVLLGFLLAFSCEEQIYSILYPSAYGHHQCRLTAHAHTVSYTLSNEHICFRTKLREGLVGKILHHSTNYGLYNLMHGNISAHSGCGILGEQRALCTFYHCWWWIYIYFLIYINEFVEVFVTRHPFGEALCCARVMNTLTICWIIRFDCVPF